MGLVGSKVPKKKESTADVHVATDLIINTKEDLNVWNNEVQNQLNEKIKIHKKATDAAIAIQVAEEKKRKKKKNSRKKGQSSPLILQQPAPARIDDGVRSLNIKYSLSPKEANTVKRTIKMTKQLQRITIRNHFGGPGVGYRDEIASRVLLAIGKWFGESHTICSLDLSNNDIGGSTSGSDKRTGDSIYFDIRKVGPNGSYLIQGLADSKLKRYEESIDSTDCKTMERIVLKHNNLTHYGYYYRKVGVSLRNLFSNKGRIISLDFSHCLIGCDAMAKGFSNGLFGIEKLNLTNNQLGGRFNGIHSKWESSSIFIKELKNILLTSSSENGSGKENFPPLRSLNISSNRLNAAHCKLLSIGLLNNNTLKNINLSFNSKILDNGIESIINSQSNSKCSILEMLDLRETGMSNMSIFHLKKLHSKLENVSNIRNKILYQDEDEDIKENNHIKYNDNDDDEARSNIRNLVIDISVNQLQTNQLPEAHGDSKVRFITNSWRHLVNGRANVATLSQIQNHAVDFIINGAKFERKYKKNG